MNRNRISIAQRSREELLSPKTLVDPNQIIINGERVQYFGPLTILVYKPAGIPSQYPLQTKKPQKTKQIVREIQDEEDAARITETILNKEKDTKSTSTIFSLLPPLFVRRNPIFNIPLPLPIEACGLELLTQYSMFLKCQVLLLFFK